MTEHEMMVEREAFRAWSGFILRYMALHGKAPEPGHVLEMLDAAKNGTESFMQRTNGMSLEVWASTMADMYPYLERMGMVLHEQLTAAR